MSTNDQPTSRTTASQPIRKAVIPAAGLGTRFLPFSKAVPKEMLPIVDKPVIQYVVEEAVTAGIDDILIITSGRKKAIEDHFAHMPDLEQHIRDKGRDDADAIAQLADLAQIQFVCQDEALGLGHAVGKAQSHVGPEPFLVLLGDSVIHSSARVSQGLIDTYQSLGTSVVALMEVEPQAISSYGCAVVKAQVSNNVIEVGAVIEKPLPAEAPSNLAVSGRYLFTPEIFDEIAATQPGLGGEIQLADAMNSLLATQKIHGFVAPAGRFDTGNKSEYLRAVLQFALERDDLGPQFAATLEAAVNTELYRTRLDEFDRVEES